MARNTSTLDIPKTLRIDSAIHITCLTWSTHLLHASFGYTRRRTMLRTSSSRHSGLEMLINIFKFNQDAYPLGAFLNVNYFAVL